MTTALQRRQEAMAKNISDATVGATSIPWNARNEYEQAMDRAKRDMHVFDLLFFILVFRDGL